MRAIIPPTTKIRAELLRLTYTQMQQVAARSGVPFSTLWNVRTGNTENPGIETVRKFLPFIARVVV